MQVGALNLELTPVRYTFDTVDVAASLQGGEIAYNSQDIGVASNTTFNFFYGASVGVRYNQVIGITADTKIAKDFQSLYSINLVGSY